VRDVKRPQGALELTARIGVVVAGTRPEEAQGVGVNRLGQAMVFEGGPEMLEVIPGGVALDEAACDKQARAIINGEQQGLFLWCRPPLVNGAIVLP
jgi:hypothetical protein